MIDQKKENTTKSSLDNIASVQKSKVLKEEQPDSKAISPKTNKQCSN